jgi:hypothetical protein
VAVRPDFARDDDGACSDAMAIPWGRHQVVTQSLGQENAAKSDEYEALTMTISSTANSTSRAAKNQFDALCADLVEFERHRQAKRRAARKRPTPPEPTIAKALGRTPARKPMPLIFGKATPSAADLVAKSFAALQHSETLSAADRGALMLGLSGIAGRVFSKSQHPAIAQVDEIKRDLDAAMQQGHADRAMKIIAAIKRTIAGGRITPGEHACLSIVLSEASQRLKDLEHAK